MSIRPKPRDHRHESLGCEGCNISIDIIVTKLDQGCHYSAISYCWGRLFPQIEIEVEDQYGPSQGLRITAGLSNAMEHLRGEEHVLFWIDALCIDQSNVEERSREVARMAEIYSKADEVLIWVGDDYYDGHLAMQFIPRMCTQEIDRLIEDKQNGRSWRAFGALMRRPWFTRRWII